MSFRTNKELKQKMLIKQTINEMNKQISKLEQQKQTYINAGAAAKKAGLDSQYKLAVTGLRMTIVQQKRVQQMKLNFEITSQMKDMSKTTADFLKGMSSISKDMMKLTKDVNYKKITQNFSEAMMGAELQTEQLEQFMEDTSSSFETSINTNTDEKNEVESLIDNVAFGDSGSVDVSIEKELEELKKKMAN